MHEDLLFYINKHKKAYEERLKKEHGLNPSVITNEQKEKIEETNLVKTEVTNLKKESTEELNKPIDSSASNANDEKALTQEEADYLYALKLNEEFNGNLANNLTETDPVENSNLIGSGLEDETVRKPDETYVECLLEDPPNTFTHYANVIHSSIDQFMKNTKKDIQKQPYENTHTNKIPKKNAQNARDISYKKPDAAVKDKNGEQKNEVVSNEKHVKRYQKHAKHNVYSKNANQSSKTNEPSTQAQNEPMRKTKSSKGSEVAVKNSVQEVKSQKYIPQRNDKMEKSKDVEKKQTSTGKVNTVSTENKLERNVVAEAIAVLNQNLSNEEKKYIEEYAKELKKLKTQFSANGANYRENENYKILKKQLKLDLTNKIRKIHIKPKDQGVSVSNDAVQKQVPTNGAANNTLIEKRQTKTYEKQQMYGNKSNHVDKKMYGAKVKQGDANTSQYLPNNN